MHHGPEYLRAGLYVYRDSAGRIWIGWAYFVGEPYGAQRNDSEVRIILARVPIFRYEYCAVLAVEARAFSGYLVRCNVVFARRQIAQFSKLA